MKSRIKNLEIETSFREIGYAGDKSIVMHKRNGNTPYFLEKDLDNLGVKNDDLYFTSEGFSAISFNDFEYIDDLEFGVSIEQGGAMVDLDRFVKMLENGNDIFEITIISSVLIEMLNE